MNDNGKTVEFRLVNDEELPPVVITMNDDDEPKVVINAYHKIWLSLHRKTIGGCGQPLFDKIDAILAGFLTEQRDNERMA